MRALIRKSRYIVREEGVVTYLDRAGRAAVVRLRRLFRSTAVERRRWQFLRDKYAGQRVFLIGNGPSLNRTPLHLLRREHTMCFNRFNLMFERLAWRPTFYATTDDRVLMDIADEINRQILPAVDYAFFPDLHPYNVDFTRRIEARENVYWLQLDALSFSLDLPRCGMNKTVTNVGLQILAFLGFREIYLIGVDCDYQTPVSVRQESARDWTGTADDDPNHFDPRYFGAGRRYHHPRMDETIEKYREGRDFFELHGVRVVNVGVGGKLEEFPRLELRSLFQTVAVQTELEWLLEPAGVTPVGRSLEETFPDARRLERAELWDPRDLIVLVSEEIGVRLVPRVVFTHIPLGPFDGKYVLLRRSDRS